MKSIRCIRICLQSALKSVNHQEMSLLRPGVCGERFHNRQKSVRIAEVFCCVSSRNGIDSVARHSFCREPALGFEPLWVEGGWSLVITTTVLGSRRCLVLPLAHAWIETRCDPGSR